MKDRKITDFFIEKCGNKICGNLSRRFENKFCSILCADVHDGTISELEWRTRIG